MDNVEFQCCICGKEFKGYGNNPAPVSDNPEDRCCDLCNLTKVLPARFERMFEKGE